MKPQIYTILTCINFFLIACFVILNIPQLVLNHSIFNDLVSPISSAISVILIIITLGVQRQESKENQFESHFFFLLERLESTIQMMDGFGLQGRRYIEYSLQKFKEDYYLHTKHLAYKNKFKEQKKLGKAEIEKFDSSPETYELHLNYTYMEFYNKPEVVSNLGHYFRLLYHIFKYVEESNIKDKKRFFDILQAQMSNSELVLTFYNAISEQGKSYTSKEKKFQKILDNNSILENIHKGTLLSSKHHIFYPKTKFKFLS